MAKDKERRNIIASELRVFTREDKKPVITGYAAVFDTLSEDLGGFKEKIDVGAFRKAIKGTDVRALWNHSSDFVLGRTTNDTLTLKEDKRGLFVEITPPGTTWADDLLVSIDRGDVSGMSFGFTVREDKWEEKKGETPIRTLIQVDELFDVSPVTFPAYPDTEVGIRKLEDFKKHNIETDAVANETIRDRFVRRIKYIKLGGQ